MNPPDGHADPSTARGVGQALRSVFLFQQWSEPDLDEVEAISSIRGFPRDDILFHHGTPCGHFYVVLDGRVQLSRLSAEGRETVIHVIGSGELLACAALFLDRAYPATARVVSADTRLLVLDGARFLEILERRSDLAFRVIAALSMRISNLAGRIESRANESAEQRLASWLLREAGETRLVRIPSTKKALAEDLGMTPETLSRLLAKFRREGILKVDRREIEIVSSALLEELD